MRIGGSSGNIQAIQAQAFASSQQAVQGAAAAAAQLTDPEQGEPLDPSQVIEAKEQSTLYTANSQVVAVADEMAGQVLNLRA